MCFEEENGQEVYAIYLFIVAGTTGLVCQGYEDRDDAIAAARDYLNRMLDVATDSEDADEICDEILEFDTVSFCDVARREVLYV